MYGREAGQPVFAGDLVGDGLTGLVQLRTGIWLDGAIGQGRRP